MSPPIVRGVCVGVAAVYRCLEVVDLSPPGPIAQPGCPPPHTTADIFTLSLLLLWIVSAAAVTKLPDENQSKQAGKVGGG